MKSKKHQPGHFNQAGVPSCLSSDIACSVFVYFCIPKFSRLGSQLQFDRLCASVAGTIGEKESAGMLIHE